MIKSKIFTDGFCLETDEIKLRPSKMEDLEAFLSISSPSIWTHMSHNLENPSDWEKFLSQTISDREHQIKQEFAIILKEEDQIIGATSIGQISELDNKVEIGLTWISEKYQGKGINQKVKGMLLTFLFEELKINKVEFRTRGGNLKSQRALNKIGATKEGVLRKLIFRNGKYIDVVYFGILASEWKNIKRRGAL
ncbi:MULTISPECIES: GNAT family N-acetyltransferase [Flavobacteriaceae]|uniref:GNAT family N-acetyltransferase n=1 Tax=Flavobacteriaceae TaxID=49546 RepID=UPI0034558277